MWINKIIYLAIAIYSVVLALLYFAPQTLYIAIIFWVFPLLMFGLLLYIKRKISLSLITSTTVGNIGQPIACTILVQNQSIFPIGCMKIKVYFQNDYGKTKEFQTFSLSMNGNSEHQIHFKINSKHAGNITIATYKVKVYDYLRLFSRKIPVVEKISIPVLPDIHALESAVFIKQPDFVDSDVYSKMKSGDDPSEVFDIREYKAGDKVHRIHWKLSTKKDVIMVKEYSLPITCAASILIDTSIKKSVSDILSYMDTLLSVSGSVSYSLLLNEQVHTICWYDYDEGNFLSHMIHGLDDMYYAVSSLLRTTVSHEESELLQAFSVYGNARQLSKVYYITDEVNETAFEQLSSLFAHADLEVFLVCEDKGTSDNKLFEEALSINMKYQYVTINNSKQNIEGLTL